MNMALKDRMIAIGRTTEVRSVRSRSSIIGRRGTPVTLSRELERVIAIPRHGSYSDEDREVMNAIVSTSGKMRLFPAQADALLASIEADGAFGSIGVGAGKTLTAALIPTVLPCDRPIILTRGGLVEQTERLIHQYSLHFRINPRLQVHSYSKISHKNSRHFLAEYRPDLIVCDEAHALRDRKSACTKRFMAYVNDDDTAVRFLAFLSGTMCKRSIRDYAHLSYLSLRDWTPLPRDFATLKEWSEAIDPNPSRDFGALKLLCEPGEDPLDAYSRRLRETRGVIVDPGLGVDASLIIEHLPVEISSETEDAIDGLDATWERPDGEMLCLAMEVATVRRQLVLGGYYGWKTPPPKEWIEARRAWHRTIRSILDGRQSVPEIGALDSPGIIEDAARAGLIQSDEWDRWALVADYVPPPRVWKWIDREQNAWLKCALDEPTIIFSNTTAPARAAAKDIGLVYHGQGTAAAKAILDEDGSRSIVCSIDAHKEGRNLQMYKRAILMCFKPTGSLLEQVLGRLHRTGQLADEVTYLVPTTYQEELFRARDDAIFLERSLGQRQKLCYANFIGFEGMGE